MKTLDNGNFETLDFELTPVLNRLGRIVVALNCSKVIVLCLPARLGSRLVGATVSAPVLGDLRPFTRDSMKTLAHLSRIGRAKCSLAIHDLFESTDKRRTWDERNGHFF
jgi:hypothetical protein